MKKITAFFLCTLLLIIPLYPAALAVSVESDIEHFDDGSYITVTYVRPPSGTSPDAGDESWEDTESVEESSLSVLNKLLLWIKDIFNRIFAKQSTVTKAKYCNYFSSDGELLWSVCLKGKFTYNHRTATCVSSEINYEIFDSDWKLISAEHREEGNTAEGEFSIRQYKLGVPLKLIEKVLTLICDKDGNIK